ncbi:hypothetical protein AWM70_15785 [Paenibacillus yonginensis]|uniref:SLH domain-containing protein n=2 Tax=Paenibacillus yonginensis TaxID=1462996 RepID=A0A1B1N367_9BACL|nr:hypothetical protein AWM70_15785 [Paenibacillus yonginensis]
MWVGKPKDLVVNDNSNTIRGLDNRMEYSVDNGQNYTSVEPGTAPLFAGAQTVMVRYKADQTNGYGEGEPETYTFTTDEITEAKKITGIYVPSGMPVEDIPLPEQTDIVLNGVIPAKADVVWNREGSNYNDEAEGTYTFYGTITPPEGAANGQDIQASAEVTVQKPIPAEVMTGIVLDDTSYRLEVGTMHSTVTTAVYSSGRQETVTEGLKYTSSHPEIATVNDKGMVTGLMPGQTEITVSYSGFEAKAEAEVWTSHTGPLNPTDPTIPGNPSGPVQSPGTSSPSQPEKQQPSPGSVVIFCGQGGCTANLGEELTAEIPAQAAGKGFTLQMKKVEPGPGILPVSMELLSPVFELTKSFEGRFLEPITLHFRFQSSNIGTKRKPALFYYNETAGKWVEIEGKVSGSVFTAEVDHFTKFAVFSKADEILDHEKSDQSGPPENPVAVFTDTTGHWAADPISKAAQLHIVGGFPDGRFRPDQPITRAEFTVMLARALGLNLSEIEAEDGAKFTDLSAVPEWAVPAVRQASAIKLVYGLEDGTFRPNTLISRAEMLTMLVRAAGQFPTGGVNAPVPSGEEETNAAVKKDNEGVPIPFTDAENIPAWAEPFIGNAWKIGLVQGREGGRLEPGAAATRAEAVTMILRLLR